MSDKWHNRFLNLATHIATEWSLDPSTKVGSVIVDDDRRIVSVGYNGFPKGIADTKERLENRDVKYKMIVHAERNALLFANKSVKNCTLYNVPFMPCSVCAGMIIQAGIKTVVSYQSDNPRWGDDQIAKEMFAEAGVELLFYKNPNTYSGPNKTKKSIWQKFKNLLGKQ